MDYYEGFCFRLDYYNKIWWNYYETLNTNTVSTAQIVRYFIKELGSQFEKIYKDFIDVDSVSNKSLELSRQVIQDWDEKYENGLYKINSVCCVAIPGFIYKTAPTDCHTLYDSINDKIDSFGLLSDEEYIELIEKIFMMRFGMKPQDSKSKEVEFFIPAMLPVFSASLDKKKSFNVLADYKLPDDEDIYVDGYFYIKDTGEYVGHSGNSEDCYAVTEKKLRYCSDGQIVPCYSVRDAEDLQIKNDVLNIFANTVAVESLGIKKEESFAIASAIINLSKYRDKTLLITLKTEGVWGYRDGGNNKNYKNNYRYGMSAAINALQNGIDYSNGAIRWDGFDLAGEGFNHDKPMNCGIRISETLFNEFKNVWSSDLLKRYSGGRFKKFNESFKSGEYKAIARNNGMILYEASAVYGGTIFWKATNEPAFKGYY